MTTPTSRSAQSCRQLSIEIELLICHSLSLPQQRHTEEVLHKTGAASQSERGGSKANGGMSHTLMFFFLRADKVVSGELYEPWTFTSDALTLLSGSHGRQDPAHLNVHNARLWWCWPQMADSAPGAFRSLPASLQMGAHL